MNEPFNATEEQAERACHILRSAIEAAENSNQAGENFVVIAVSGPDLLAALEGVMDILGRAESDASGNPAWDFVGPRVAAARAAVAKAKGMFQ